MTCILCDCKCSSCPVDPDYEELPDISEFNELDLYDYEGVEKNE